MSEIKEKIELELKPLESVCDNTLECLKNMVSGSECHSPEEVLAVAKTFGEIVDAKKDIVEMCYKKQILEAMEESEYGEDYDENGRRFYRNQPRDSRGRYMSRGRRGYDEKMPMPYDDDDYYCMTAKDYRMHAPEYYRDMDRMNGIMYYTESGTSNGNMNNRNMSMNRMSTDSNSRYDKTRRSYTEMKEEGKEDLGGLEMLMNVVKDDVKELSPKMTPSEKKLTQQKLRAMADMLN